MKAPFRLYINQGCPHCVNAMQFLASKNVAFEMIEKGFDPIIKQGCTAEFNTSQNVAPVLISFGTQEVLLGFDPVQYDRVVRAYLENSRGQLPGYDLTRGHIAGAATAVDIPPLPPNGGAS